MVEWLVGLLPTTDEYMISACTYNYTFLIDIVHIYVRFD